MQPKLLIGRTKLKALNEFCYLGSMPSNYALIARELGNHTKKPACLLASWSCGLVLSFPKFSRREGTSEKAKILMQTPQALGCES